MYTVANANGSESLFVVLVKLVAVSSIELEIEAESPPNTIVWDTFLRSAATTISELSRFRRKDMHHYQRLYR